MNEQDERLEWVTPTIKELDIVSETQNTPGPGSDGETYS
jgi:hypothetical protein